MPCVFFALDGLLLLRKDIHLRLDHDTFAERIESKQFFFYIIFIVVNYNTTYSCYRTSCEKQEYELPEYSIKYHAHIYNGHLRRAMFL